MPLEVVKLFSQTIEVLNKEHLTFGARTVPEGNFSIAVFQTLKLVKDVGAHRRHPGSTPNENHLFVCIACKELAKRTGDCYLVTWFQVKDVGRHLTGWNTLAARRWRCHAHVQHNKAFFIRIVCHGIGAFNRLGNRGFKLPQVKLVPILMVLFFDCEVLVAQFVSRRFDLNVATSAEVHILTFGQFQHKVFDEGCDVFVGAHSTLPLFYAKHLFWHLDVHVLLHSNLTRQTVAASGLALGDVAFLGWQNRPATGMHTHLTLRAGAATATG
mmetsp:Transcript_22909/g.38425  ORF Transcript_22909/g.38425 Transcript_22909/m.38425 type:complete len:270 (+) Transcript_22909:1372-2181(+)